MTALAVLRHGPTPWNAEHRLQGRSDIALSLIGEAEVRRWRLPAGMRHWRRCHSPLQRAVRTARLLSPAMPCRSEAALIEMSFGDWEGATLAELRHQQPAELAANEARGLDFRPPGGETPRETMQRLTPWLARIGGDGRPTLAVAHKGVLRALLALATGWDMQDKPPLRLRSAALHLFEVSGDGSLLLRRANIALCAGPGQTRRQP